MEIPVNLVLTQVLRRSRFRWLSGKETRDLWIGHFSFVTWLAGLIS